MHPDTKKYNEAKAPSDRTICELLAKETIANTKTTARHANP